MLEPVQLIERRRAQGSSQPFPPFIPNLSSTACLASTRALSTQQNHRNLLLLSPNDSNGSSPRLKNLAFRSWNLLDYLKPAHSQDSSRPFPHFISPILSSSTACLSSSDLHTAGSPTQDNFQYSSWLLSTLLVVASQLQPLRMMPRASAFFARKPVLDA